MTIKPIETRYAGCRFRSRLEARWAVFFDTLHIPWEYEPEGFETSAGCYLPDFRLTLACWSTVRQCIDDHAYLEVKPDHLRHQERDSRWFELAKTENLFVAFGINAPVHYRSRDVDRSSLYEINVAKDGKHYADSMYYFCWCPRCKKTSLTYLGSIMTLTIGSTLDDDHYICCGAPYDGEGSIFTGAAWRIMDAYALARSARFDHGQSP